MLIIKKSSPRRGGIHPQGKSSPEPIENFEVALIAVKFWCSLVEFLENRAQIIPCKDSFWGRGIHARISHFSVYADNSNNKPFWDILKYFENRWLYESTFRSKAVEQGFLGPWKLFLGFVEDIRKINPLLNFMAFVSGMNNQNSAKL